MRLLLLAEAVLAAALITSPARAQSDRPIVGIAQAQDGDSLEIAGTRIRLFGIDAPEFDQSCTKGTVQWACGAEAADRLQRLVTGREVRCAKVGRDPFDRVLGRCTVHGIDVNKAMVESGFAIAFRKYSTDYVGAEERAKSGRLGMWAGTFEEPSKVRLEQAHRSGPRVPARKERFAGAAPDTQLGACRIKGNKSRRGEWIYHLPGMPYYAQTRAEEMFCTEAEARAAGYRRSRAQ